MNRISKYIYKTDEKIKKKTLSGTVAEEKLAIEAHQKVHI